MAVSNLSLSDWPAWLILLALTAGAVWILVLLVRGIRPAMIKSVELCTADRSVKVHYMGGTCRRINEWPCGIRITRCVGQGGRAVWANIEFKTTSVVIPILAAGGFDTPKEADRYASDILLPLSKMIGVEVYYPNGRPRGRALNSDSAEKV